MIVIGRGNFEKITDQSNIFNGDCNQITILKKWPKITIPDQMIADQQYPGNYHLIYEEGATRHVLQANVMKSNILGIQDTPMNLFFAVLIH